MKKWLLPAVVFMALAFSAHAQQDVSKDIAMGKQGYEEVVATMGLYHDADLNTLVSGIGNKLVAQLDAPLFPYEFYVVDAAEPNAFALPGGKIFVTRGLLLLPLTEDELAGVIGHEIIHSQNRHSIKQQRNSIWGALVALPGLLVGGIFQGPMAQAVATPFIAGGMLLNAQYSQSHESEADKQGIALAAKAGYKPLALSAILARLSAEVELLTGQAEEKNYFASHPYTPKRVANIKKTAEKLTVGEGENVVPPLDFLARFNSMPLSANPEFGFVKNDVLYHPVSGLQVDVPNGWTSQTTPEALGLMNEKGDAMLTAELADDSLTAAKYLQKMEKAMLQQSGAKAEKNEKINWHGYEGGMLEYSGTNQGKALKVQLYVLDFKGKLLKIAAAFYTEKQGEVEHVLKTAKPLARAELPVAEVKRLRIARAVAGETLAQFAERYNATEFLKFMAVINELAENAILTAGQEIKWIERNEVRFE